MTLMSLLAHFYLANRPQCGDCRRRWGDRPILLHYSLAGGHSAGVSLTQLVADQADELAFLWNESGGR